MVNRAWNEACRQGAAWAAIAALGLVLSSAPLYAENAAKKAKDTCSLVRNAQVIPVIGRILSDPTQSGPTPDEDNPAVSNTRCQFDGESGHITIISNLFPASDGAGQALSQAIDNLKETTDAAGRSPDITPEPGLGDEAYWVTSTVETDTTATQQGTIVNKGTYFVHSGTRFVSAGTDWSDADPETLKPALANLVRAVIARSGT
jgi:hypothetical protein